MTSFEIDDCCKDLLEEYGPAIQHLRYEADRKKLGLVFGAGASMKLGFPSWTDLVKRIALHPKIEGVSVLERASTSSSKSQLLYERFRERNFAQEAGTARQQLQLRTRAQWKRIVHEALYAEGPKDDQDLLKRDPYLWAFLPAIRDSPITVTYNFDDSLERLLDLKRPDEDKLRGRGYSVVYNSNIQLVARTGVIYHPNGFLPYDLASSARSSDELIFLEDSFADQLIDSTRGHYAALANHYAQNTCLFVGLSLSDNVLSHLLRQNARAFPGRHHYYVRYVPSLAQRDQEYERVAREANFSVYNLVTLFLDDARIAALGKLLAQEKHEFAQALEDAGHARVRRYFVTGCVSVGKSSTTTQMHSLLAHGEWTRPMPRQMNQDPSTVAAKQPEALAQIDKWVAEEVGRKNKTLSALDQGVHVIDRAPLDAFAFETDESKWPAKAKLIAAEVTPNKSKRVLCEGHIVLLTGAPEVLALRSSLREKDFTTEQLSLQQSLLLRVYQNLPGHGVTVVDTRERTISEVVQDIAHIIYLETYVPARLSDALKSIAEGTALGGKNES